MDHGDRPVGSVEAPQDGQGDGMVTAHGDDAGERLAGLGEAFLVGIGEWLSHEDAVVALFDLADCPFVVVAFVCAC